MRLKQGSEAWHRQLNIEIQRLRRMVEKHEDRQRREADHTLKMLAQELANIPELHLTMSVVCYEPRITFINQKGKEAGFYDRSETLIYLVMRADEYWDSCGKIIQWYNQTGRKRVRKGSTHIDSTDNT